MNEKQYYGRPIGVCLSCESILRLVILINEILMEHALQHTCLRCAL